MGTVLKADFARGRQESKRLVFSADVYTTDIERHRFEVEALTPHLAHQKVVSSEAFAKLPNVRTIAFYERACDGRSLDQLPILVCHYKLLGTVQNL